MRGTAAIWLLLGLIGYAFLPWYMANDNLFEWGHLAPFSGENPLAIDWVTQEECHNAPTFA